ncbi:MAG: substrate-binding domain-containing protein [bacterium]|jgi:tungstate transport system substrate-binding protein|nr:substrate-binding domain-containing protein [Betaproteobacteria bacterium]
MYKVLRSSRAASAATDIVVRAVLGVVVVAAALGGLAAVPARAVAAELPAAERVIRLATTTSTENSGLLGWLLPPFEKARGYSVRVVSVGTGAALKLGANGDADLVLVHARAAEDRFVAAGHGIDRRDVMFNDFVLVGPKGDPAGLRKASGAAAALRTVAERQLRFVSRGDDSGTHHMELDLWKSAGGLPKWPGYLSAGRGMGEVLAMASELQAHALTDRGTWASMRSRLDLAVLSEGDPALANPYGVIAVNPARHPGINAKGARDLMDWLTSPEGQARIGTYRVGGETLFFPGVPKSVR